MNKEETISLGVKFVGLCVILFGIGALLEHTMNFVTFLEFSNMGIVE